VWVFPPLCSSPSPLPCSLCHANHSAPVSLHLARPVRAKRLMIIRSWPRHYPADDDTRRLRRVLCRRAKIRHTTPAGRFAEGAPLPDSASIGHYTSIVRRPFLEDIDCPRLCPEFNIAPQKENVVVTFAESSPLRQGPVDGSDP